MVKKLYPGGKAKAFNISYDDGVEQDVRFVQLLNKYGLKGTFNLNSGLMKQEYEWVHECGMTIKRLPESAVVNLYQGHEVASHTSTHPYMHELNEHQIMHEMHADRNQLKKLFGVDVSGFAVPFMYYSELIAYCAKNAGFEYARCSEKSNGYAVAEDFYWWRGGKFHWDEDLEDYVDGFLKTGEELAICQIVGHSYDLDVYDMWDRMEEIMKAVSEDPAVWPATHIELVRYLRQMGKAVITSDWIRNDSAVDLWFCINGKTVVLHPGEKEEIL